MSAPPRSSDLISFSSAQSTPNQPPPTYSGVSAPQPYSAYPTSPYSQYTPHSNYTTDPYYGVRHEDASLGQRITSKISQKLHNYPPPTKPSPSAIADTPYSYPLSSLAPSSRAPTIHTTPTPAHTSIVNAPYYRSTGSSSTSPYSLVSNYQSPASTVPTASSVLRNGSPSKQRPDPFASLLANSVLTSTTPTHQRTETTHYSSTRGVSPSHQRPQEPTLTHSSATRGISPAHQRPSEGYSSSTPTRGTSPPHQRPSDSFTSSTRPVQRPSDYYSAPSRGLSVSRPSAYPPAPTLNTTPTRGTSPVHQRPTYDASLYTRGLSPARSIPESPTHATPTIYSTTSTPSSAIIGRTSSSTRPSDSLSYYDKSFTTRNPSPSRIAPTMVTTSTSLASRRNPSPARTSPSSSYSFEPSSIYSRVDKSSISPSYAPRDTYLDANLESYFQKLRLAENVRFFTI